MKTVTIQIGNSDDKLSQKRWAEFSGELDDITNIEGIEVHFFGYSCPTRTWQNACVVANINDQQTMDRLLIHIKELREAFEQDSIAVTIGDTQFI